MITGKQLLHLYSQAGHKNPFGYVNINFGVQINGEPETNGLISKKLLKDFEKRGIKLGRGRVPNFNQLRLEANQEVGLTYVLAEDVCAEDIPSVSTYPFGSWVGKNGTFNASFVEYEFFNDLFNRDPYWHAHTDNLHFPPENGRIVRYDPKETKLKKLRRHRSNLVTTLKEDFMKRVL